MIKTEFYMTRPDGVNLYRTYSDQNVMIRQIETRTLYEEAIDIEGAPYTYEETDLPIDEELTPEQVLDILFGGDGHEQSDSH